MGVFSDIISTFIVGVMVVYILAIFMGAFFAPVIDAINGSGIPNPSVVIFIVGSLVLFIALALLMKIWNIATGSGGSSVQQ